jgi:hypothetical protein
MLAKNVVSITVFTTALNDVTAYLTARGAAGGAQTAYLLAGGSETGATWLSLIDTLTVVDSVTDVLNGFYNGNTPEVIAATNALNEVTEGIVAARLAAASIPTNLTLYTTVTRTAVETAVALPVTTLSERIVRVKAIELAVKALALLPVAPVTASDVAQLVANEAARQASENAATEKVAADKKAAADKLIADKAAADKLVADKAAADAAAVKAASDKLVADKAAADSAAEEADIAQAEATASKLSMTVTVNKTGTKIVIDLPDIYSGKVATVNVGTKKNGKTTYKALASFKAGDDGKKTISTKTKLAKGQLVQLKIGKLILKTVTVK